MVINYRKLNDKTVEDNYLLVRMEDLLENLGECTFLTTLDITQRSYQIPVDIFQLKRRLPIENGHFQ